MISVTNDADAELRTRVSRVLTPHCFLPACHYFETALDLSLCIRGSEDLTNPGFYLIMAMGSEQAGLTGLKGSIVREAVVGRSVSSLRNALTAIKNTLENK